MSRIARSISMAALLLALFALVGTALVALTHEHTRKRIAANERAVLEKSIQALLPAASYDNDLPEDWVQVRNALLGTPEPVTVYRARQAGQPVALLLTPLAPDGYGGAIKLLVGIWADGTLAGVRVIAHKETPGLGDKIELDRSDWILGFVGRSLGDPQDRGWTIKRDGGAFDQFSGASITPRAVVKAVHRTLLYFRRNPDQLFAETPTP